MAHTVTAEERRQVPPGPDPDGGGDSGSGRRHRVPRRPPLGGGSPGRPRRTLTASLRGRPGTVPARLRLLRTTALAVCAALAAVLLAGGASADDSWSAIRTHSAPQVTSAAGLYFALSDMDAQVANQLLTPGGGDAARIYGQRRSEAAGYLRDLAEAAAGDPAAEREVAAAIRDVGRYEERAARALLLGERSDRAAVDAYRSASALMRTRLLPEADALVTVNDASFERAYGHAYDRAGAVRTAVVCTGLLLLAVLVVLQLFLARRFRRVVSPALAAATLIALAATAAGTVGLGAQRDDLTVARRDAFDSVLALTRARSVAYDANADESRYLLDRAHAAGHEADFLDKSQRLARLPGVASVDDYDPALARALDAYRADPADLRFTGFLGDEFRNITFPGERPAAERALLRYQAYERDDRTIRALAGTGRLPAAVAYGTGYGPGESNHDFAAFDRALGEVIAINSAAYERAAADGADRALSVPLGLAGALVAAAALVVLGLRPRLAEFR